MGAVVLSRARLQPTDSSTDDRPTDHGDNLIMTIGKYLTTASTPVEECESDHVRIEGGREMHEEGRSW